MPERCHLRSKTRPTSNIQPAACHLVFGLASIQDYEKEIATIYPACDVLSHSITGRQRQEPYITYTARGWGGHLVLDPTVENPIFLFFFFLWWNISQIPSMEDQKLLPGSPTRFTGEFTGNTWRGSHSFPFRLTPPPSYSSFLSLSGPVSYSESLLSLGCMYLSLGNCQAFGRGGVGSNDHKARGNA